MRFRETNHLRKLANEMGKQMRGPRRSKASRAQSFIEPICRNCQCREWSHNPKNPDFEWHRRNGTCEKFVAEELKTNVQP